MEQALINTVIAFKIMHYSYSLKCFFKEEFKKKDGYLVPFFPLIRDACDYVCPHNEQCDGHKFLDFVDKLWEFQYHVVTEKKCFFREFYFFDFHFKRDKVHEMEKVAGWNFYAITAKNLSHL